MIYLWISLGIFGGIALIFAFVWLNNSLLKVTRYNEDIGLGKELKIIHLSDLHGKSFGRKNARLIKKIAAEKPDIILITGDIVHKYRERDKTVALELVSALSALAPVAFSAGNHEMRNKGYRFFRKDLIEAGAVVLDDCSADICGLTVTGLNCASLKNGTADKIKPVNAQSAVLLAHMPQFIQTYARAGFGLVLSGHAHGGQWRIPFTGVGFYAPGQGVFPKLTSGVHACGNTRMIISRGLGNSQCPLRLFNPPEIVVIKIK
ncbi:MAG: metallophosphoesterase [Clostridia bacterium]|nr:metallophosphoesterase [Clostridia bacterium]